MKISCEIIKDLLPIYHDDVCSDDTKTIVEEHFIYCDSCKSELQEMDDLLIINNVDQNLKEAEAVRELSKTWKKGMLKSLMKGILITTLTIAILAFILFTFVGFKVM